MRKTPATRSARRRRLAASAAVFAVTSAAILGGSAAAIAAPPSPAAAGASVHGDVFDWFSLTVKTGQTAVVTRTRVLFALTVQDGGALVAPEGYSLTLTVNGVETGQKITPTGATETTIVPGSYRGLIVLSVKQQNPVEFSGQTYQFRQGLYVDANGVERDRSVLAAVRGFAGDDAARNVSITSTGEGFNGIYVVDADYTLVRPRIQLTGNGRSDFAGMGAGIVGSGADTRLVIDGAQISNQGVTRPAIIATNGSNVIVKNSTIQTKDGTLPSDYISTVDLSYMQSAPWMLGISGNNRATNVLGEKTQATYISSSVTSENWGALSVDTGQDMKLTAINSTVANSGIDGYGSYVIGNATERFLGDTLNVATYSAIIRGGSIAYGDSTKAAVSALNDELSLGLSARELATLPVKSTSITSKRFGVMWHGSGSADISGHTSLSTAETLFLNKGQQAAVTVDGSQGATLSTANGVLYQLMDDDDPGPVPNPDAGPGKPAIINAGVYHQPTGPVTKDATHDVTTAQPTDATTTLTDISVTGDVYNAMRGDQGGGFGPPPTPRNLVLTLDGSSLTGVVSASTAVHHVDTITAAEYRQLGEVTNTVGSVVNNGVIVSLTGDSTWTVTGTSYLSSLTVQAGSTLVGAGGATPVLTVNGVVTPLVAGATYTGDVQVTLG